MSSMQPDHHIVNIISCTIVFLILHPTENLDAMFNRAHVGYFLHSKVEVALKLLQTHTQRESIVQWVKITLDKKQAYSLQT